MMGTNIKELTVQFIKNRFHTDNDNDNEIILFGHKKREISNIIDIITMLIMLVIDILVLYRIIEYVILQQ